jgi:hypothetical protein
MSIALRHVSAAAATERDLLSCRFPFVGYACAAPCNRNACTAPSCQKNKRNPWPPGATQLLPWSPPERVPLDCPTFHPAPAPSRRFRGRVRNPEGPWRAEGTAAGESPSAPWAPRRPRRRRRRRDKPKVSYPASSPLVPFRLWGDWAAVLSSNMEVVSFLIYELITARTRKRSMSRIRVVRLC